MVRFGQIVIGSPGAGKSTYCRAAGNYLNSINRDSVLVNLDPGRVHLYSPITGIHNELNFNVIFGFISNR